MDEKFDILQQKNTFPLCVDLDGTLLCTDVLLESVFVLLKQNILYLFLLPFWLLNGKAKFKQHIAQRVNLDVALLPYNQNFLRYLKDQKQQGRPLILATAANVKFAQQISYNLGIFNQVLSSDNNTNLSGSVKRQRLVELFGEKGFDYAGNSHADLAIWSHAREAIIVNPDSGVTRKARKIIKISKIFQGKNQGLKVYLSAIRIHQWAKNLLVFVPLIMGHKVNLLYMWREAIFSFAAFSLCSSSVYLFNDLFDLTVDRQHHMKRHRPFAAGVIPIKHGIILIPLLLLSSVGISFFLPSKFLVVLSVYYGLTITYSLWLKRFVLVDVLVLAGLYTSRVIAGASAVSIEVSFWLLAFSIFIFFSLALIKRYSELRILNKLKNNSLPGRSYKDEDMATLFQFGVVSGYMSVLVLALYINSDHVKILYTYPQAIWMLCPLLLYWISRIWLITRRGEMVEDPVVFAITDKCSYLVAAVGLFILWAGV